MAIDVFNRDTMIYYEIEIVCHFGKTKGYVIIKFVVIVIPLVEFDICSLELEYVS